MRVPVRVSDVNGVVQRTKNLDLPLADPPAAADSRDYLGLVARLLFESHDLNVGVFVDGSRVEIRTEHATVAAQLPGPVDRNHLRAFANEFGLRWS